ncbi:ComF family protein [Gallaecimonas xiamenensis]|uniref:Putative phosphoribosyl transferase n=1 Tax=Gallaecimonas xiamenensis 3-C-1 TaxID=745411 RepID=K2KJM6_9GAMM|nr:ComF family protein [Gallaecimonas xiamenensis]EKE77520.1 putative phosphoribosyl transferase [Gallaecimonas xiamenensis 3-C-1]
MTSNIARILARLAALAKPTGRCWLCLEASHSPLCATCQGDLPAKGSRCRQCGEAGPAQCRACAQKAPPFDEVHFGVPYGPPLDALIHRFKYQRHWWLDAPLCQPLLAALAGVDRPDCLVPVPLHWSRRLWRGFNQAHLLAHHLGQALDLEVNPRLLRRQRATRQQQGLGRQARQRNLSRAFKLCGPVPAHVALVDDVMTTGTTAATLARLLKQAGCQKVQLWCLARA